MKLLFLSILLAFSLSVVSQNRYEETIAYETVDKKIILKASIAGHEYKFLLDSRARTAILSDIEKEVGAERKEMLVPFVRPDVNAISACVIDRLCIGDNIFIDKKAAFLIDDGYLRGIGVSGIISLDVFAGYVLTINGRDKTLTISNPYKPAYMPVKNRLTTTDGNKFDVKAGSNVYNVTLDLAGDFTLAVGDAAYAQMQSVLTDKKEGTFANTYSSYSPVKTGAKMGVLPSLSINTVELKNVDVINSPVFNDNPLLGAGILDKCVFSLDYSAKRIFFQPYEDLEVITTSASSAISSEEVVDSGQVIKLNKPLFFNNIFDYRKGNKWEYQGSLPAIIDFWAEWCGPCKRTNPILEELAREYTGKIIIYKLNVDEEKDVAAYFKANTLPMFLFIPKDGEPVRISGAHPKSGFIDMINKYLLK